MLWNGELGSFLEEFLDPTFAREDRLRTALQSVPEDSWSTVWCRLVVALHEEEGKYLPQARDLIPGQPPEAWVPTEEDFRQFDIINMKKEVLHAEMKRRLPAR